MRNTKVATRWDPSQGDPTTWFKNVIMQRDGLEYADDGCIIHLETGDKFLCLDEWLQYKENIAEPA